MKRNFDVVLCVRGRGAFKAGECYAMYKTGTAEAIIHAGTSSSYFKIMAFYATYFSIASPRVSWYQITETIPEERGARFVEVKRCKRKSG